MLHLSSSAKDYDGVWRNALQDLVIMSVSSGCGKEIATWCVTHQLADGRTLFFCNNECKKIWRKNAKKKIDIDRILVTGKVKKVNIDPDTNAPIEPDEDERDYEVVASSSWYQDDQSD